MAALSAESQDALRRVLAGALIYNVILENASLADKADNPASALGLIELIDCDINILQKRVKAALETLRADLRSDEEATPSGALSRALYDGLAPRPKLTVVR